jgi:polyphosphate kinase
MVRNLQKRLEILFPVIDPKRRERLIENLRTFFADNVKARRLTPDGNYEPVPRRGPKVRAQERFYHDAVEAVRAARQTELQFRPMTRPKG